MMKCYIVLIAVVTLIFVANVTSKLCSDKCFCPCRIPVADPADLFYPNQECLERIRCEFGKSECSADVMASGYNCSPGDLCFCPCRIPGGGPNDLYYPSEECLQRIRCEFGKYECSAEYLADSA